METPYLKASEDEERSNLKAFYNWMVDTLGQEEWSKRREALISIIRKKEFSIDLQAPIEPQLFVPPDGDINWYILVAELAWDHRFSDSSYSTRRIYPYAMAIGEFALTLRKTNNVNGVMKRMLSNKSSPENQIFEIMTAAYYIKNGYYVEFVAEHSINRADGSKRSPDLRVTKNGVEFFVECKRAAKQTNHSQTEEAAWQAIWAALSQYMHTRSPWHIADITFHCSVIELTLPYLIESYDAALREDSREFSSKTVSISIKEINKPALLKHYSKNYVRPNSPQHELLVFGNIDSNEKRIISTIATEITRPGNPDDILNIFVEGVSNCVAAQWRCDHEISLEKRSKHFKSLISSAISQIPPRSLGVVHILYETLEGIKVELLRREKHIDVLTEFDVSNSMVMAILIHAVNYYPKEDNFEWAETVQHFSRDPSFLRAFYQDSLMLGNSKTIPYAQTTHWEQDEDKKIEQ